MSTAAPPVPAPQGGVIGLNKYVAIALLAGAAGLGVSVLGYLNSPRDFFRAYLVAWCFCMSISLGSLCLLMLQHMVGGQWGLVLRRMMEAAASPLVLLAQAVLFLPLLLGLKELYPWVTPGDDPVLQGRQLYMNVPMFVTRFGIFFGIWIVLSAFLTWYSAREDRTTDPKEVSNLGRLFRMVSGPGLLIYALTMTFAGIDWGMSVNAHWYSTMYPVLFSFGPLLSALAFLVVVLLLLRTSTRLGALLEKETLADLASLMLAFIMFWMYITFCQFLLIWSANLKGEVGYFEERLNNLYQQDVGYFGMHTFGGYGWIGLLLLVGHFVLPFLALLVRAWAREPRVLIVIAGWMVAMRFVDYYWTIGPSINEGQFNPSLLWLDLATLVGLFGIVVGLFLWQLQRQPIVPENDPRLAEAEGHHHG